MELKHKDSWAEQNRKIKEKLKITETDVTSTKYHLKNNLQYKAKESMKEQINKTAENKSKMQYFFDGKSNWKIGDRAQYMSKLTRNQASTIFRARTRMLKVKANYKNGHTDLKCRMCGNQQKTQKHVLEECVKLNMEFPKITTKK